MLDLLGYEFKKIFKFQNMGLLIALFLLLNLVFLNYLETAEYLSPDVFAAFYQKEIKKPMDARQKILSPIFRKKPLKRRLCTLLPEPLLTLNSMKVNLSIGKEKIPNYWRDF